MEVSSYSLHEISDSRTLSLCNISLDVKIALFVFNSSALSSIMSLSSKINLRARPLFLCFLSSKAQPIFYLAAWKIIVFGYSLNRFSNSQILMPLSWWRNVIYTFKSSGIFFAFHYLFLLPILRNKFTTRHCTKSEKNFTINFWILAPCFWLIPLTLTTEIH